MNVESDEEFDISVIVIAHSEGRLAHRSMQSVQAAVDEANANGIRTEIIVILDNPTEETLDYFATWRDRARVLEVSTRDPGLNRNAGVAVARGNFIALLDADDCFGRSWLRSAFEQSQQQTHTYFVIHPELVITFDSLHAISTHRSSHDSHLDLSRLVIHSWWTIILFAPRKTLIDLPFVATPPESGFGYEDWHWYCNLLAANGSVEIAPNTCVFVRRKSTGSRMISHNQTQLVLRPTKLFDPRTYQNLVPRSAEATSEGSRVLRLKTSSTQKPKAMMWLHSMSERFLRLTESCPLIHKKIETISRPWRDNENGIPPSSLPSGVLKEWLDVSIIEPQLFPGEANFKRMGWGILPPKRPALVYEKICQMVADYHKDVLGPQFTHVYLVPWLKRGGADLLTIKYILLTASNPDNRVLVIATEATDSPWKNRLPASVHFINIGEAIREIGFDKRLQILSLFLIQLQPHVIHLINSTLGNELFVRYGRALSQIAHLFAPAFCTDKEPDNSQTGFILSHLPHYADYLTSIISENQRVLNYLSEVFAFDSKKMVLQYQPVTLSPIPNRLRQSGEKLHVLWAGRLDRQKRPDLLIEIARRCDADNIHFHAYGSSVIAEDRAMVDFRDLANLTYHGPFDGFPSLPVLKYDVFLNTSEWDGMPNILLEAVAAGLPIVSSDVGGISELIIPDNTGLLVSPFDDLEQYVQALRRLLADPQLGERLLAASRRLVAERHSWKHFATDLNQLTGYLNAPCQLENAELKLLDNPIEQTFTS